MSSSSEQSRNQSKKYHKYTHRKNILPAGSILLSTAVKSECQRRDSKRTGKEQKRGETREKREPRDYLTCLSDGYKNQETVSFIKLMTLLCILI